MGTSEYYNKHAQNFFSETRLLNLEELYKPFLMLIPKGGSILDAGCGSGRDIKYFSRNGYDVSAFDSSSELCRLAFELTGQSVANSSFVDFHFNKSFDGIWACASLLHLPKKEMPDVFKRFHDALSPDGVVYCSFKYGSFEGDRNGRYFSDLTNESLANVIEGTLLKIERYWITNDLRQGREEEKWLNAILVKDSRCK